MTRPATSLLFAYGTLMSRAGPRHRDWLGDATLLGDATFRGALYLVSGPDAPSAYPGVVPSRDPSARVHGELYRLRDPEATLRRIDLYEGCSPTCSRPHEYRRVASRTRDVRGTPRLAFVYVYAGVVTRLPRIASGSFVDFLRERSAARFD